MSHSKMHLAIAVGVPLTIMGIASANGWLGAPGLQPTAPGLTIRQDERSGAISVYRQGAREPILTQNARPDARPYLHPIAAPDGKGVVTEDSPAHHKHQTGLFWGFTRVNGRDYFHNFRGDYWRRVSAGVTRGSAAQARDEVRW